MIHWTPKPHDTLDQLVCYKRNPYHRIKIERLQDDAVIIITICLVTLFVVFTRC